MNFIKTFQKYLDYKKNRLKIHTVLFISVFLIMFINAGILTITSTSFFEQYKQFFYVFFISSVLVAFYIFFKDYSYSKLESKLSSMKYIGNLNNLFDLNDPVEKSVLIKYSSGIGSNLIENKGVTGDLIIQILDEIESIKAENLKIKKLKDAIDTNENLKLMVKQIDEINSSKNYSRY